MSFKRDKRQETIIYLALWALLFMAPVLHLSIRTESGEAFDWREVLIVWRQYAAFFLIFLIHNHLLAPILVYRQRRALYFSTVLAIAVLFQVYQCNHRPLLDDRGPRREMMTDDRRPHREMMDDDGRPPLPPELNDSVKITKYNPRDYRPRPMHEMPPKDEPPFIEQHHKDGHPPLMFGQHDIIALVILILMLGMNVAIKLYFKQRHDQKHLEELEKQNLEQQLEYLKYQINPHFFMNTLNNIHALVDIDPEKAKETILELSKMMRFVLYEGNKQGVPLDREIAFLQNYITLMRLRYSSDKVNINVKIPDPLPNKQVPPLMFITFVENAFKHGVSYSRPSFISVECRVESLEFPTGHQKGSAQASSTTAVSRAERLRVGASAGMANSKLSTLNSKLVFVCKNSKIPKDEDKHGGVGLKNVKQRLDLIYGNGYTLDIKDETDTYTVTLTIPL